MEYRDAEIAEIIIVVDDCQDGKFDLMVMTLKQNGVSIDLLDLDNGVIEGTVDAAKVRSLEKVPGVKYVRNVFTYVADYPMGDPRNLDDSDRENEDIPR